MKNNSKNIYILGINEALGASAALLHNGKIIAGALEERFTRIKNQWGFPKNAIEFCLNYAGITSRNIEHVILSYADPYPHFVEGRARERSGFAPDYLINLRNIAPSLEYHFKPINYITQIGRGIYYKYYQGRNQKLQIQEISDSMKIDPSKIIRIHHHLCHAYTAYYSQPNRTQPFLVITCDGAGDNQCGSIYIVKNRQFRLISSIDHQHSLGLFYAAITSYLGLKAHEDEYKIMGLAPYSQNVNLNKILSIFDKLFWVDKLQFKSLVPSRQYGFYLNKYLRGYRFDHIAGAAQTFLENKLIEWISNAINHAKINNLAFAGGVFLNVKANYEIIKKVKHRLIHFMPSPGDDTNAIGACYYGYNKYCQDHKTSSYTYPLNNLYLGPLFNQAKILQTIKKYKNIRYKKYKNINREVAKLIAEGKIVARFAGRMEFGARALGNRSILANPISRNVVEEINKAIKMRDFWMPFAPTMLDRYVNKYLVIPKNISSPFMILAFPTTKLGKDKLIAAIHPYDKTARPQILNKLSNNDYYDIVENFYKKTNIAGILNTSFNIHGEPIVCSPNDALSTFSRSNLKYLVMENLLITKN